MPTNKALTKKINNVKANVFCGVCFYVFMFTKSSFTKNLSDVVLGVYVCVVMPTASPLTYVVRHLSLASSGVSMYVSCFQIPVHELIQFTMLILKSSGGVCLCISTLKITPLRKKIKHVKPSELRVFGHVSLPQHRKKNTTCCGDLVIYIVYFVDNYTPCIPF